jgi:hypothetical protein
MSDETYSIFAILGSLASIGVLWARWRQGRAWKRILASLTEEQKAALRAALEEQEKGGPRK